MAARQLFHPEIGIRQAKALAYSLNRAELLLLLVSACLLVFVAGTWATNSIVRHTPPVMATISVQSGDTLWNLATEYGDPDQYILKRVNALVEANALKKGQALYEGQTLVIPVGNQSAKLYYGGKYASR